MTSPSRPAGRQCRCRSGWVRRLRRRGLNANFAGQPYPILVPTCRHDVPVPQRLGEALAEAGPSITLAAAAETLAFALGGLTSMPAVRNFALCAALAIFLDFLLQVCIVL